MIEIPESFGLMFEKIFKSLFASKQFSSVDTDATIFEFSNLVSTKKTRIHWEKPLGKFC